MGIVAVVATVVAIAMRGLWLGALSDLGLAAANEMLEVAAEKGAMDIGGVGNGFVGAFHDKSVRLSVHHLQHAVGVAAYQP